MSGLEVLDAGALTLVQDRGRHGYEPLGVGAAGAFDRAAHALANRLVGNAPDAAALEVLLGGLRLRVEGGAVWIAVTGAWGDVRLDDGAVVEPHTATLVAAGRTLLLGTVRRGLRYTLAVRGGVDVPPVLGSRSYDTLARLGPAPLVAGDLLAVGAEPALPVPPVDLVPVDAPPESDVTLGISPGPRADWFSPEAHRALRSVSWAVSARSDRTGVRLDGVALSRAVTRELPSEGMVPGAVQVSPDGTPTILGVDAPVTGGYPVIAVVADAHLDRLAQLRPGQRVRFLDRNRGPA